MQTSEVVLRFLDSIGRRSEAAYYLDLFRSEEPESFAIIVLDEDVMTHEGDTLAFDLVYLARLGLRPVLALGLPAQRTTGSGEGGELARRLAGNIPMTEVRSAEEAKRAVRAGELPVLSSGLEDETLERRFATLGQMAIALKTRKILLLDKSGGISPHGGHRRSVVDLTREYDELTKRGVLPKSQKRLVEQASKLLDRVSHPMTIAITSPLELLRELFTVHGSGTLLRRGATIERYRAYDALDRRRLNAVMRSAFGTTPRDDFYERPVNAIYVAGDYDGAAIVSPTPLVAYLNKFAVDQKAQGEGVGRDLWRAVIEDHPSLIWRSREENVINPWYLKQCEGMVRVEAWNVFWRNLPTHRIPEAIAIITAQPIDFVRAIPSRDSLGE